MEQEPEVKVEEKTVVVAEGTKKKKEFVFTEKRVESLAKARQKRKENSTKKLAVEADPESEEEEEKPKKKAKVVTKERDEEDQNKSRLPQQLRGLPVSCFWRALHSIYKTCMGNKPKVRHRPQLRRRNKRRSIKITLFRLSLGKWSAHLAFTIKF